MNANREHLTRVTIEDVLARSTVFTEDDLGPIFRGQTSLDVYGVVRSCSMPIESLLLLVYSGIVSDYTLHKFSILCAHNALAILNADKQIPDTRAIDAVTAKVNWLFSNHSTEELETKSALAFDAEYAAGNNPKYRFVYSTVCAATLTNPQAAAIRSADYLVTASAMAAASKYPKWDPKNVAAWNKTRSDVERVLPVWLLELEYLPSEDQLRTRVTPTDQGWLLEYHSFLRRYEAVMLDAQDSSAAVTEAMALLKCEEEDVLVDD